MARSSGEAKFWAIALGVCEGLWLKCVMKELKISNKFPMKMFCYNQAIISISHNPVHHDKTKHVEIDRHFIKEKVDNGEFLLQYMPTTANILTKALPR